MNASSDAPVSTWQWILYHGLGNAAAVLGTVSRFDSVHSVSITRVSWRSRWSSRDYGNRVLAEECAEGLEGPSGWSAGLADVILPSEDRRLTFADE